MVLKKKYKTKQKMPLIRKKKKYKTKKKQFPFSKDRTRDLKGLRVDSPCDNLFLTAIDI